MWKKSLILSSRGSNLNELKENETFVKRIVWVWATPTVKSYTVKPLRIRDISALCINQRGTVYFQRLVKYLKDYFVWFRNKGSSFEFSTSYDLRFYNTLFLSDTCFVHVLLLEYRKFWLILKAKVRISNFCTYFLGLISYIV